MFRLPPYLKNPMDFRFFDEVIRSEAEGTSQVIYSIVINYNSAAVLRSQILSQKKCCSNQVFAEKVDFCQGTTDLPIKPINRPIYRNLPIIGITDHINPYIGSVSDRPIIRACIG